MSISITNIYEALGKTGAGSIGDNMSLSDCVLGAPPSVNPNNVSSLYNRYGNAWGYTPQGDNTISMGTAESYISAGDFVNNSSPRMLFKFVPPSDIAADLYGDNTSYPRTFPYNKGELGVRMNNTSVTGGPLLGTYSYAVNANTTWTSVVPGDSYKVPNSSTGSATICMWIKPITPVGTARNFIWADIASIGTVTPYRGWWAQYNTNNTIGFNRGDGTGGAASDRYSFTGSAIFDGSGNYWQFLAFLISYDENIVSTSTNYMWAYVWNGRSYAWSNGATYTSGSGGSMAWSIDSGTETTNCMANNPLSSTSAGLAYDMGHFYVYNGELSTTQVEYVRELTDGYSV